LICLLVLAACQATHFPEGDFCEVAEDCICIPPDDDADYCEGKEDKIYGESREEWYCIERECHLIDKHYYCEAKEDCQRIIGVADDCVSSLPKQEGFIDLNDREGCECVNYQCVIG
ncbi:MAG: hypothetical protein ABIH34_07325, partial [Nanoarchaeota archaeon]